MTNRNLHTKYNWPFLLKPVGKDYIWGGNRLNTDFSKEINIDNLAETWECSTHPNGVSIINSGEHKGKFLSDLLMQYPEYLGERWKDYGEIPILVKFIDANKDLSIQVHPDDEYAYKNENGQKGKIEMWYVIDTIGEASIVYGLHHSITKDIFLESVQNKTIEKYLQKVKISKGDNFFIQPGQIHAIGAGSLIAEIQENSDITYRIYDYDRIDKNGEKRTLHIDKAADVVNLKASCEPRQQPRIFRYYEGYMKRFICSCKYFQVEHIIVNTEICRKMVEFQTDDLSFQVFLCISGCGSFMYNSEVINFFKGDCIFIPAYSAKIIFHGKCEFLQVCC